MIDKNVPPFYSSVPGSTVTTNRTVELIKLGHMFLVQKVFRGLTVGATKLFLLDLAAVNVAHFVLYDFSFSVTQGKAYGTFYEKGDYADGDIVPIYRKNENKNIQIIQAIIKENPLGTTLGVEGASYLSGGDVQGLNLAGGMRSDKDTPSSIDTAVSRILKIEQVGGSGDFDLELRLMFAEIPLVEIP